MIDAPRRIATIYGKSGKLFLHGRQTRLGEDGLYPLLSHLSGGGRILGGARSVVHVCVLVGGWRGVPGGPPNAVVLLSVADTGLAPLLLW